MRTGLPCPQFGGKYLALAATGTVADLVPLVSANRILARSGLRNLNANSSAPLSHLAAGAGLSGKTLTAGHIGFYLGPRINAAGRVSEGQIAYELLTSKEPAKLARLAAQLEELNAQRRAQEEKIVREISSRLAQNPPTGRTLVLGSADWRPGVVGIAASKVQQDLFYAPVVILSIDQAAGVARGSARSISGFNMHHALSLCSDLLIRWGGHKAAAGLTIAIDRIEEFAEPHGGNCSASTRRKFSSRAAKSIWSCLWPLWVRSSCGRSKNSSPTALATRPRSSPCAAHGSTQQKCSEKSKTISGSNWETAWKGSGGGGPTAFALPAGTQKACLPPALKAMEPDRI